MVYVCSLVVMYAHSKNRSADSGLQFTAKSKPTSVKILPKLFQHATDFPLLAPQVQYKNVFIMF